MYLVRPRFAKQYPTFFNFDSMLDKFLLNEDYLDQNVKIKTNDNGYDVNVILPEFNKKDVEVSYENNILKITAINDGNLFTKKFEEHLQLNKDVDVDKVKSKLVNGVLKIELPFAENEKRKLIEIT